VEFVSAFAGISAAATHSGGSTSTDNKTDVEFMTIYK
jgi:hypothetical protein